MRGQLGQLFAVVEIVGELGARRRLAVADTRKQTAAGPDFLAQRADQLGVLGESFGQDRPGAIERRIDVGYLVLRADECGGCLARVPLGMGKEQVGKRLEASFSGDLRLRPPLRLVRQIDVLEPRLAVRCLDRLPERIVELALLADAPEDRRAALFQLAQVSQPLLQRPQLRVVEGAGRLLAVAGDERHGRASVEQRDRRFDLPLPNAELFCDALTDRFHRTCTRVGNAGSAGTPGPASVEDLPKAADQPLSCHSLIATSTSCRALAEIWSCSGRRLASINPKVAYSVTPI